MQGWVIDSTTETLQPKREMEKRDGEEKWEKREKKTSAKAKKQDESDRTRKAETGKQSQGYREREGLSETDERQ